MALINASGYGELSKMTLSTKQQKKPGKFFPVSIAGKRRGKINAGYYQCVRDDENEKFFILNESEVYFLPLYIKRYWVKYSKAKRADGSEYELPCAFGWEDNAKKPDDTCKYEYKVAGYLYDNEKGCIRKHEEDYEEAGIKADDPVMIYFLCKGTRCSCAYQLIKSISEKAKDLPPLSDNPTFEQNVVSPRRFLIKAGIQSRQFQFGPNHQTSSVDIFDFQLVKTIPDDNVQQLLEASNKWLKDFNEQFDKTQEIADYSKPQTNSETTDVETVPAETTKSASVDVTEQMNFDTPTPADNFDIGL